MDQVTKQARHCLVQAVIISGALTAQLFTADEISVAFLQSSPQTVLNSGLLLPTLQWGESWKTNLWSRIDFLVA